MQATCTGKVTVPPVMSDAASTERSAGDGVVDEASAREKTRTAYQNFLTLWKDADPDIPIYKQAKAEYAKLQ